MAYAELAQAIENGVIDGGYVAFSTVATSLRGRLFVSDAPGTGIIAVAMVMSTKSWDALPESQRKAITNVLPKLEQQLFTGEREQRRKLIADVRERPSIMLRTPPVGMKEQIAKARLIEKSRAEYLGKNPTAGELVQIAASYMKVAGGTCQKCAARGECPCQNDLDRCSKECTDCCQ
jgi:TRAP-type C4-dicarboxylate transport system substrate-binding protein